MVLRDPSSAKWQLSFIDESNNVFHWRDELVDNNEQESILREQARQLHLMLTAGAQKSRCKCEDQSTSHSAVQSTMNWGRRMQHFQQLRDEERLRRGFNMKTLTRKAHKQESRHWDWRPHIKSLVGLGSFAFWLAAVLCNGVWKEKFPWWKVRTTISCKSKDKGLECS